MIKKKAQAVVSRSLNARFHRGYFLCRAQMSANFSKLFFEMGSMTKMLKSLSRQRLTVTVLRHAWQKPSAAESKILSLTNDWGIGREVVMSGGGKPWLFGRAFFPESVVKAHGNSFLFLGVRPLGEVLFSNPLVSRSDFTVSQLLPGHSEYQEAAAALGVSPEYLWARRSEFSLPSGIITLLEVFSPNLQKATQNRLTKK